MFKLPASFCVLVVLALSFGLLQAAEPAGPGNCAGSGAGVADHRQAGRCDGAAQWPDQVHRDDQEQFGGESDGRDRAEFLVCHER